LFEHCLKRFASIRHTAGEGGLQQQPDQRSVEQHHDDHSNEHGEHNDLLDEQGYAIDHDEHNISVAQVYVEMVINFFSKYMLISKPHLLY
jgi:hypothetical protein